MTYPVTVTAKLYSNANVFVADLDNASNIAFTDALSDVGSGRLTLPFSDPLADDMVAGRFVGIFLNGTRRFTFIIEGDPEYRQIGEGEEAEQVVDISGPGWAALAEHAIVRPEFDITLPLDPSWRVFSFASPSFPNGGAWPTSTELYEYLDVAEAGTRGRIQLIPDTDNPDGLLYPSPVGFPWPNSPKNGSPDSPTTVYIPTYWIWPSDADEGDEGYAFFFDDFTLADYQPVTFSATADNLWTLFLEGVPILGEEDDEMGWLGYKEVTIGLPAGTYRVGAVVRNVPAPLAFNPGGFLYAAYVATTDLESGTVPWVSAHESVAAWKSNFSTTEWPGWTPGQILIQLITEAEARGCWATLTGGLSTSFTGSLDTDSATWQSSDPSTLSPYVPSFSIELGKTLLDAFDALYAEGWLDWHIRPDVPTFDAWGGDTVGSTPGITFAHGVNITSLVRGETKKYANALLVQWAKGYTEVEDTAAITALGFRVEDFISTDAETIEDAERIARVDLAKRAVDAKAAVMVGIEPNDSTHTPYEGFTLGDYLTMPSASGGTESIQCLSITCEQDGEGYAVFTLEMNERWRNPIIEQGGLLRSIGGKSLGSASVRGAVV